VALAIERFELGGVPIFWLEGPPPFLMGLLFRVGRADETLPVGGITHLVEHLVIPAENPIDIDYNGTVSQIGTYIWATGREATVREFIRRIAANCAAPPLERLDTEREILRAEAATRGRSSGHALRALRFGTVGHGQPAYEEYGLRHLTEDDIFAWSQRWFGATNLALCVTGAPPKDLSALPVPPGGPRVPAPTPEAIRGLELPAYYSGGPSGELALSLVAKRSVALTTALAIFEHRVRQRLRYDLGVSYGLSTDYDPLSAASVHYTAHVDFLEPNARRARDEVLAIIEHLAESGPAPEELERELARRSWLKESPAEQPSRLFYHAAGELTGEPVPDDEYDSAFSALTLTTVAEAFAEAASSLLLIEPPDLDPPPPSMKLQQYPLVPTAEVSGRTYPLKGFALRPRKNRPTIVAGDDGVALKVEGPGTTVRFDECTASLRWSDGTRGLWSADGFYIEINPKAWRRGTELVTLIDSRVPDAGVVAMDAELEPQLDAAVRAIDEQLERRWLNRQELDLLPSLLEREEELIVLANASRRWRIGVVAATDRRLLFMYVDEVRLDLQYEEISEVSIRRRLFEKTLRVRSGPDTYVFTDIRPHGREEDLRAAIQARLHPSSS
jgi:predicted Zn-dependent peptidase